MEEFDFCGLIRRVRGGDQTAAAELVRRYEPAIRRAVRVRLTDPHLDRLFDSMDICQSVMASFFVRVYLGQFDLETPVQLLRLLRVMARNKLLDQARKHRAWRRNSRAVAHGSNDLIQDLPGREAPPDQILASTELLEKIRGQFSPEEWHLVEQRALGRNWADLSTSLGRTPEALRKQLARAIDRALQESGLENAMQD